MKVGVVVGRFQCHYLHEGHEALLDEARYNNDYVVVFIGVSAISGTKRNPLDFATRHQMLMSQMRAQSPLFPYSIEPIKDQETDEAWSEALDKRIFQHVKYGDTVTLYGGEDSFLDHYKGTFKAHERLKTPIGLRATEIRKKALSSPPLNSVLFRQGAIYSIGNMRDTVSCTVDMVCFRHDRVADGEGSLVLLGRKADESTWRFPGGFVDATDQDLEAAARREFREETGLSVEGRAHYAGSRLSDDWRFRNSPDKAVMTSLFVCAYTFGAAKAGDDLAEVRWVEWWAAYKMLNTSHQALHDMANTWASKHRDVLQSNSSD